MASFVDHLMHHHHVTFLELLHILPGTYQIKDLLQSPGVIFADNLSHGIIWF